MALLQQGRSSSFRRTRMTSLRRPAADPWAVGKSGWAARGQIAAGTRAGEGAPGPAHQPRPRPLPGTDLIGGGGPHEECPSTQKCTFG